ncbi:MAG: ATP-binding protein [Anaerolineae bacterium]|nr:Serine-protein kinase RsbW [Anaerolineales bacterium]RIK30682.1 MAG: ATP-binding protein [Anaerolineae bacterium]WKZ45039.1 MAG: ATP-binding protein [Anaerolineales bacterium]WKZ47658.1 MAG: ATP-binding protein [Anaerolineales bacterium]
MKTIHFPAKFEFLDEIREFVGTIARENGFGDKDVYNIQLATDEAASNIIEHAYEDITDGVLDLSCGMQGEGLTVILVDHGAPFDPSEVPMPDLQADLADRKIGGLGIFLMRKLMDEVHYHSNSDKSNVLTMLKRKG